MLLAEDILGNAASLQLAPDQRLLCAVMERVALAVTYGLPVQRALRALPTEPELARTTVRAAAWRSRLAMIAGDLEEGRPLSAAFERHLGRFLPAHFVPALRQAEEADCVATALPLLVRNLSASTRALQELRGVLAYPVIQFLVMASILSGLLVFIVPKFSKMADEMMPGYHSRSTELLSALRWVNADTGPWLVLGIVGVAGLSLAWPRIRHLAGGRRLIESVCLHLPVVGRFTRRLGLVEAAGAMTAFLAAGADVSAAAQRAAASVESGWARQRLAQFASALAAGTPWPDAWMALAVQAPLCDWMLRNAAARERPCEGFQAVAEWAADDLARRRRRFFTCLEPCLILVNALVIGGVAYTIAGVVFSTVYATLNI